MDRSKGANRVAGGACQGRLAGERQRIAPHLVSPPRRSTAPRASSDRRRRCEREGLGTSTASIPESIRSLKTLVIRRRRWIRRLLAPVIDAKAALSQRRRDFLKESERCDWNCVTVGPFTPAFAQNFITRVYTKRRVTYPGRHNPVAVLLGLFSTLFPDCFLVILFHLLERF
jgi:hypothetical protein